MKIDFSRLDRAFNPQTLVIVGDRLNGMWFNFRKNYKGQMYSVQVNAETAKAIEDTGIKNYPSVADVPGPVDLVIVAAPRAVSMQILDDCIRKDVAAVHYFTAGFSETGVQEWIEAERRLTDKAKAANMHLIGPNCMGIYNTKAGIGQGILPYSGFSAPICLISQSGTHASNFCQVAYTQAIDIDRGVSFGNGLVLDAADYLEYFDQDPVIKVIGMYLEGVRDGKRFLNVLRKVAAHKPVVIWKGGRTEEGGRAISSHTASLAVSIAVWESAVKQCGAVPVGNMEELVDTMKALLFMPPVRGGRMGITGGSGGPSVAVADTFAEAGLKVPLLTDKSYSELASFYSLVGGGYRNPIDTGNTNRREMKRIMEILKLDANVDNIALLASVRMGPGSGMGFGPGPGPGPGSGKGGGPMQEPENDFSILEAVRESTDKPVMVIAPYVTPEDLKQSIDLVRKFQDKGIPAFSSMERGARALKNALEYYRHRDEQGP